MNKRGQFYLIAAVIIIGVIIGFAAVSNSIQKTSKTKLYDLSEELGVEGEQVLDHGTFNNADIDSLVKDFTQQYSDYAGEGRNLFFVYGDENKIYVATYQEIVSGTISIDAGGTAYEIEVEEGQYTTQEFTPQGNLVIVTIENFDYEFELQPGENFYFIISQEIDDETHVVQG